MMEYLNVKICNDDRFWKELNENRETQTNWNKKKGKKDVEQFWLLFSASGTEEGLKMSFISLFARTVAGDRTNQQIVTAMKINIMKVNLMNILYW